MITNPLLRSSISLAISLIATGFFLLSIRKVAQHPSLRLYRGVLFSFAWMFGSMARYSLCQMVLPFLANDGYNTLGSFLPIGAGAVARCYCLRRARYTEDTAAALLQLFILVYTSWSTSWEYFHAPPYQPSSSSTRPGA